MNISEGFIKRPIATSLLMAAIALFGAVAYRSLPVSDLPNVDFPTLLVTAQLPGASPETMGSSVATPLENQFSMIAGLESMTSVNSLGITQITLEFDLNRNLDGAAVDVQAAITQAARLLPQGMPTPPTFTKVNPADQPMLYLVGHLDDRCRRGRSTSTPKRASPSASRWSAASPRCRCSAARSTRCTRSSIRTRWRRGRSASTRSRRRSATGTSTRRPARSSARTRPSRCRRAAS